MFKAGNGKGELPSGSSPVFETIQHDSAFIGLSAPHCSKISDRMLFSGGLRGGSGGGGLGGSGILLVATKAVTLAFCASKPSISDDKNGGLTSIVATCVPYLSVGAKIVKFKFNVPVSKRRRPYGTLTAQF